jgi:hypothetical protein
MACYRNSTCRRSWQSQQGRGLRNVFQSIYRKVAPTLKAAGAKVLTAPMTKAALTAVKDIAANAGLNVLKDTLKGEDVSKSVESNVSVAKRKLSQALLKQLYKQTGRGRKRKRLADSEKGLNSKRKIEFLFDDDSVPID